MSALASHPVPDADAVMHGSSRLVAPIGGTTTVADCVTALRYLLTPNRLVEGAAIAQYERAFERQVGVGHAYSFASGRVGLYGLLRAMHVGQGDEVLVQVPTHVVVPNAIRYTGAAPVFVDSQPDTFNMDLDQAEQRITARTKVLLLQHTFGIPIDLDAALDLAARHRLRVIEDCAHALGATYDGRHVGSFGDAAFFSTEEKTISSGMGGVVVTNDPVLAELMEAFQASCARPPAVLAARYLLKVIVFHLITEPSIHRHTRPLYKLLRSRIIAPAATSNEEARGERPARYQQRLSNAQAALALSQLRRLAANLAHREKVANAYTTRLEVHGFPVPRPAAKARPAFARYPICVPDKAAVMRAAAPHAVLGQWLSEPVDGATPPGDKDYEPGSCPAAERIVAHLVNLPTHLKVRMDDVERIVAALTSTAPVGASTSVAAVDGVDFRRGIEAPGLDR
jgi:perosamine synthetase